MDTEKPGGVDEGDTHRKTTIRRADPEDWIGVMGVFESALLAVDASVVRERIAASAAFLAEASGSDHVRGALVLSDGTVDDRGSEPETGPGTTIEIEAIGVRRRYRDRGIGRALIDRARRETDPVLLVEFDDRVRPFYAALGFRVEPTGDGRFRGYDTNDAGCE